MPKAYGLAESTAEDGSNVQAVHDLGETGQGLRVGILGGGNVDPNHYAFDSIIIDNNTVYGLDVLPNRHDTIMAGIIASQGWGSHADCNGVAPGVDICSMRVGLTVSPPYTAAISEGLRQLVNVKDCRVIVAGYHMADKTVANGDSQLTLQYDYHAYNDNVVFANPAGKFTAGSITQITVPGDSYNAITTAGLILNDPNDEYVYRRVGTESLSGPTVDGRKKP